MPRWLGRTLVVAAFVVLGLLLSTVAAWGVDRVAHVDRVNRNVTLAGVEVGGMTDSELDATIDRIATESAADTVMISAPGLDIVLTRAEAGVSVDREATRDAVFAAGRQGNPVTAFGTWVGGLADPVAVEPVFTVDAAVASAAVAALPDTVQQPPVEPGFTYKSGEPVVTEGADGIYVDPGEAAEALAAEVQFGTTPFSVDVPWSPMKPQFDNEDLVAGLSAAEQLAAHDLAVRINGKTAHVGSTTIRRWIDSAITSDGLVPVFNEQRVTDSLESLLDGYATPLPQPVYTVVNGKVTYGIDGDPARTCCGEGAAAALYDEAQAGGRSLVFLPTRLVEDDFGKARIDALGVSEQVSEFTTNHACCQNRVENIHRIADLMRGVVIMPGERFSVNDFIGPRTREKGFVSAGTIQQGHYKDDVGGGISQFATTMFNASFFAGLELDDYKAHSIYISRYPYGREATLNYPDVDLAVINNTPYAILIWTEYTDTSITVQMYSTHYWDVEQTGQSSWRSGACTAVETDRSRTNPEGETFEDSVSALYRPGEGLDCAGHATPRP
ncbi:MAG: VanW family protein [Acidimicrobiia bacterium]